ncbi:MAG: ROK family protein [Oscillospiraceae bacterium]|nr:ROK family protein [Oscillospiraceae bacterium]
MSSIQKSEYAYTRRGNARRLLSAIYQAGTLSRVQAADVTGVNIMTVGRIVEEMIGLGILQEREKERDSHVGRPPKYLSLSEEHLLCASMVLDRDMLRLGLVGPQGQIASSASTPLPAGDFVPERIIPWMADELARFLMERRDVSPRSTVGIVVPGILDIQRGEMVFAANLHWDHVPLLEILHKRLPEYEFIFENDVKAAAVAEYRFGGLGNCRNLVVLNISNGIGAAAIVDGELYRGRNNMAGEIGHIIINPAGKVCTCGKVGCLQTYLTPSALLSEARTVYPNITVQEMFTRFRKGDPFIKTLIHQLTEYISIAINLLANTYAPEVLILRGDLLQEGPVIRELVSDTYRNKLNWYMRDAFELRFEQMGRNSPLIGGGILALERELDRLCGIS